MSILFCVGPICYYFIQQKKEYTQIMKLMRMKLKRFTLNR